MPGLTPDQIKELMAPVNPRKFGLEQILVENSTFQTNKLRKRLLETGLKEHKCENCNNTEWMGKPIPLELSHKNGVNNDHRLENLELLCPNCHAQTPTYRGKNWGMAGNKHHYNKRA
jgi:Zn finger protein HypA/HybF involved in hydrogenase expression